MAATDGAGHEWMVAGDAVEKAAGVSPVTCWPVRPEPLQMTSIRVGLLNLVFECSVFKVLVVSATQLESSKTHLQN